MIIEVPIGEAVFSKYVVEVGIVELNARLLVDEMVPPATKPLPASHWDDDADPAVIAVVQLLHANDTSDTYYFSHVDIDPVKATYEYVWKSIWLTPGGTKENYESTPPSHSVVVRPWERIPEDSLHFGLRDRGHASRLSARASEEWQKMVDRFRNDLIAGKEKAIGRVGSPLAATKSAIPPDAWKQLGIDNWGDGSAIAPDGQRVFAVGIVDASTRANGPKSRRPTKLEKVKTLLAEIYPPNGIPHDEKTDDDIEADVAKLWSDRFPLPRPGKDTIRRASGRRQK